MVKVFQNISGQVDTEDIEDIKQEKLNNIFSGLFTKQNMDCSGWELLRTFLREEK